LEEKNCNLSLWSLSPSFETTLPPGTAHLALRTAAWKKKQRSKVTEQGEDITQKRQRRGRATTASRRDTNAT